MTTEANPSPRRRGLGCVTGCFFISIGVVLTAGVLLSIDWEGHRRWSAKNRLDRVHCERIIASDGTFAQVRLQFVESSATGRTFTGLKGDVATTADFERLKSAIGTLASLGEKQVFKDVRIADQPPQVTPESLPAR